MKLRYVLVTLATPDVIVAGPFATAAEQDAEAKRVGSIVTGTCEGVFRAEVGDDGKMTTKLYTDKELGK